VVALCCFCFCLAGELTLRIAHQRRPPTSCVGFRLVLMKFGVLWSPLHFACLLFPAPAADCLFALLVISCPKGRDHLDATIAVFQNMVAYHDSCSEVPFSVNTCRGNLLRYLQAMAILHNLWKEGLPAEEQLRQPWHLRPKAHLMMHLACDKIQMYGSPASFWCYGDENFVGKAKIIAMKSRHPATISTRVLQKLGLVAALGD
jgi:hypothetical protein